MILFYQQMLILDFADSPDNGSTFSFTGNNGFYYATFGSVQIRMEEVVEQVQIIIGFMGWNHDATSL